MAKLLLWDINDRLPYRARTPWAHRPDPHVGHAAAA